MMPSTRLYRLLILLVMVVLLAKAGAARVSTAAAVRKAARAMVFLFFIMNIAPFKNSEAFAPGH